MLSHLQPELVDARDAIKDPLRHVEQVRRAAFLRTVASFGRIPKLRLAADLEANAQLSQKLRRPGTGRYDQSLRGEVTLGRLNLDGVAARRPSEDFNASAQLRPQLHRLLGMSHDAGLDIEIAS